MYCASYIHRFISMLDDGQVFTTRDCLIFGTRDCVDKALQKLVKANFITRLARGVFARFSGAKNLPSFREIAIIKARAFGKELRVHGLDTAANNNLIKAGNEQPTYYVDGSSSSFVYFDKGRIHLKKASKKRVKMTDSKAGLAIRALWVIGKKEITHEHISKISHYWHSSREEMQKILLSKAWMPAWLGDKFQPTAAYGPDCYDTPWKERDSRVSCSLEGIYTTRANDRATTIEAKNDSDPSKNNQRIAQSLLILFSRETARVSSFALPIWSKTLTELSVLTSPS